MPWTRKRLSLVGKTVAAVAIVALVARHFALILGKPELHPYPFALRPEYLVPAGLLYLAAHTCWAGFWVRLLRREGVRVSFFTGLRAYFISQFGKYVPGKAWVIFIRVAMLRGSPGGHPLAVGVTATYETLTSMGAGALLAALLLPGLGVLPDVVSRNIAFVFVAAGLPLGLGTLNRLAARRVNRLRGPGAKAFPSPSLGLLVQGLLQGAVGWCLLGLSLALTVKAVAPEPPEWDGVTYQTDLGAVALSYVAGFVVLVAPGGIGVRELVLEYALRPRFEPVSGPDLADALAGVIALVLRLTWTTAEILLALGLYGWRFVMNENTDESRPPADDPPAPGGDGPMSESTPPLAPPPPGTNGRPVRDEFPAATGVTPGPDDPAFVSLVIPVLNERESLSLLFAEIVGVARDNRLRVEVVLVDDGSTDGSWEEILRLAAADPRVRGVRFRRNFGKAAALAAGFKAARGGSVLTLDADLQDDPHEIPRFLAALAGGLDVVSGWKKVRHDPWHKVWPSRVFNSLVSGLTGVRLHDHNCGMKAYRAGVFREIRLYGELHRFIPVLADARGFKVGELVIRHRPRKYGYSKYGVRRFAKGLLDLFTVKFLTGFGHRPQHLLGNFGLIPLALGVLGFFGLAVNAAVRWFSESTLGASAQTQIVVAILSVGLLSFGTQMVILGLIAELIVDRGPDDLDPYCIADRTPVPLFPQPEPP